MQMCSFVQRAYAEQVAMSCSYRLYGGMYESGTLDQRKDVLVKGVAAINGGEANQVDDVSTEVMDEKCF